MMGSYTPLSIYQFVSHLTKIQIREGIKSSRSGKPTKAKFIAPKRLVKDTPSRESTASGLKIHETGRWATFNIKLPF